MAFELGLPGLRPAPTTERRRLLSRRIQVLVAATITYNVIEAVVALTEGTRVSSTALIGFGLDSVIEVSSAAAVAWQFAGNDPEAREKTALRIIAFSFFGLALYVTVDAVRSLLGMGEAQHSVIGIALAAVSLVVMPVLSWAQRRAGRELGSLSAVADSKQTLLCTYLSACCWWDCCSTVCSAGHGRTRSPPWSSRSSRSRRVSMPGRATPAAQHPAPLTQLPHRLRAIAATTDSAAPIFRDRDSRLSECRLFRDAVGGKSHD